MLLVNLGVLFPSSCLGQLPHLTKEQKSMIQQIVVPVTCSKISFGNDQLTCKDRLSKLPLSKLSALSYIVDGISLEPEIIYSTLIKPFLIESHRGSWLNYIDMIYRIYHIEQGPLMVEGLLESLYNEEREKIKAELLCKYRDAFAIEPMERDKSLIEAGFDVLKQSVPPLSKKYVYPTISISQTGPPLYIDENGSYEGKPSPAKVQIGFSSPKFVSRSRASSSTELKQPIPLEKNKLISKTIYGSKVKSSKEDDKKAYVFQVSSLESNTQNKLGEQSPLDSNKKDSIIDKILKKVEETTPAAKLRSKSRNGILRNGYKKIKQSQVRDGYTKLKNGQELENAIESSDDFDTEADISDPRKLLRLDEILRPVIEGIRGQGERQGLQVFANLATQITENPQVKQFTNQMGNMGMGFFNQFLGGLINRRARLLLDLPSETPNQNESKEGFHENKYYKGVTTPSSYAEKYKNLKTIVLPSQIQYNKDMELTRYVISEGSGFQLRIINSVFGIPNQILDTKGKAIAIIDNAIHRTSKYIQFKQTAEGMTSHIKDVCSTPEYVLVDELRESVAHNSRVSISSRFKEWRDKDKEALFKLYQTTPEYARLQELYVRMSSVEVNGVTFVQWTLVSFKSFLDWSLHMGPIPSKKHVEIATLALTKAFVNGMEYSDLDYIIKSVSTNNQTGIVKETAKVGNLQDHTPVVRNLLSS